MIFPVATYNHSGGRCSITGGYVYRGTTYPNLVGKYFFADYCSGEVGWVDEANNLEFVTTSNNFFSSFGQDESGQLYVLGSGKVYKIIGETMGVNDQNRVDISIFPNPTSDFVHITSNKPIEAVSIYSAEGKLIQTLNGNATQIDISSYPKGVYLVTIQSGKITKTQKVIKK